MSSNNTEGKKDNENAESGEHSEFTNAEWKGQKTEPSWEIPEDWDQDPNTILQRQHDCDDGYRSEYGEGQQAALAD